MREPSLWDRRTCSRYRKGQQRSSGPPSLRVLMVHMEQQNIRTVSIMFVVTPPYGTMVGSAAGYAAGSAVGSAAGSGLCGL